MHGQCIGSTDSLLEKKARLCGNTRELLKTETESEITAAQVRRYKPKITPQNNTTTTDGKFRSC
jgi:hypothetical protein